MSKVNFDEPTKNELDDLSGRSNERTEQTDRTNEERQADRQTYRETYRECV